MRAMTCVFMIGLVSLAACGNKKGKTAEVSPTKAAMTQLAASPPDAAAPVAAKPEAPPPKMLHLVVKSTPSGADAMVDGKGVGKTPANFDLVDDGHEHEFSFEKDGFKPAKYRVTPVRDGLVAHVQLQPVHAGDAGL